MATGWEEGRGAPLDSHPLRSNPIELGAYPQRSAAYQNLSEEDEANRAREIEEGLAAARASAAAELQNIRERQARKFATVEDDTSTDSVIEPAATQYKSTANSQDAGDGASDAQSYSTANSQDAGDGTSDAQSNSTANSQDVGDQTFEEIHVDIEARPVKVTYRNSYEPEVVEAHELVADVAWLQWLRKLELALNMKLGIETEGVTRIQEVDKESPSTWNIFFIWITVTCHAGTVPIGLLGAEFGLSFHQCIAAIVVGNILGALCTAFCGTLGPKV